MVVKTLTNGGAWTATLLAVPLLLLARFVLSGARPDALGARRVLQDGGSPLLSRRLMEYCYWGLAPTARLLVRLRVPPTAITLSGLSVVTLGAALAAQGYLGLAGPLILLGSLSDILDGVVARQAGLCSDAGEYIDAVVDRLADLVPLMGLAYFYRDRPWALLAVLSAMLGAFMVSYARAKAEALQVTDAPRGTMRRAERAVYLGLGIFLAPSVARLTEPAGVEPVYYLLPFICTAIALGANASALYIGYHSVQRLKRRAALRPQVAPGKLKALSSAS